MTKQIESGAALKAESAVLRAESATADLDERIRIRDGLELRVLRWPPVAAAHGTRGSARPFLLVHGLASNARLWDGVGRRLAAAGDEAAAVDLRGHGRSDKLDTGYDFETIDADLVELIRALDFDRPVVVGQSWGANVALDLAVREPELLSGIVLVDGGLADMQDTLPTWEECWARLAPPRVAGLPYEKIERHMRSAHPDWPEEGIGGMLANFEVCGDGTVELLLTRERHAEILRSLWAHRPSRLWPRLRVPALIVPADTGDADWTAAKRANVEAAETALRASGVPVRVQWFAGDHDIHAQHPGELAGLLDEAVRTGFFGLAGRELRPPGAEAATAVTAVEPTG